MNTQKEPQDSGNQFWQNPYSKEALLPIDIIQKLRNVRTEQNDADIKETELLRQGWRVQVDVAKETGLGSTVSMRTMLINAEENYLPNGRKPTGIPGEAVVKGKELVWKHPFKQHAILLAPSYVQSTIDAEKTYRTLIEKGYQFQRAVAKQAKLRPQALILRTWKIDPNKNYLPNGRSPTGAEEETTVKGSELRWQHPYNKDCTLLAPSYAAAIIETEEKKRELLAKGYTDQQSATAKIGLNVTWRAQTIDPEKDYLPDGRKPTGVEGEVTIKGSELRWRHLWDPKMVLLSPQYAEGMAKAEEEFRQLIAKGYLRQGEVAKKIGLTSAGIRHRTGDIIPDADYLPNGLKPTGAPGEETVKGSALRWQNPYDSNIVLLSPSYVEGMIAADKKYKELLSTGYQKQKETAKIAGLRDSAVAKRTNKIIPDADYFPDGRKSNEKQEERTVKGDTLRWQHPYDRNTVLIPGTYAEGIIAAEEKQRELLKKGYQKQGEVAKKIGFKKDTILPDYTRKQINPEGDYLSTGRKPLGVTEEIILKGSEVRWQHPYNDNLVLLHSDYAAALIEKYKNPSLQTLQKGATTEHVGTVTKESLPEETVDKLKQLEEQRGTNRDVYP